MSSTSSAWAWAQIRAGRVPTDSGKMVLIYLADECDSAGMFYRPQSAIAAAIGIDKRTVLRALTALQQANLLKIGARHDGVGRRLANTICLGFSSGAGSDSLSLPSVEITEGTDKLPRAEGVTMCHPLLGGDNVSSQVVVKNTSNNNNQKNEQLAVDANLAPARQLDQIIALLQQAPTSRQQFLADEIFGQLRQRGQKIKNPVLLARAIVIADAKASWNAHHFNADFEAARRAQSARPAPQLALVQPDAKAFGTSPFVRAAKEAIKRHGGGRP